MRTIIKLVILSLMSFSGFAIAQETWFCTSESGKRSGDSLWACGVGEDQDEGMARKRALDGAVVEFKTICQMSADCVNRKTIIEPKRLTCVASKEKGFLSWKCYRLLEIHLQ